MNQRRIEMTLQELCDKALKHAEAADRLDHGQGSVIYEAASEVLALSTLSLAYSALATIAGQCSDFELPTGGPGLTKEFLDELIMRLRASWTHDGFTAAFEFEWGANALRDTILASLNEGVGE
jgi:hypothetical protein